MKDEIQSMSVAKKNVETSAKSLWRSQTMKKDAPAKNPIDANDAFATRNESQQEILMVT